MPQKISEKKIEKDLDQMEKVQTAVLKEEHHVEQLEEQIKEEQKELSVAEKTILTLIRQNPLRILMVGGLTKKELHYLRLITVHRLTKRKFLFAVFVAFAVVLVWRGLWELIDITPVLSSWWVSLVAGLIMLWLVEKYTSI